MGIAYIMKSFENFGLVENGGILVNKVNIFKNINSSISFIMRMIDKNINTFNIKLGRIFDAVSSIIGIRDFTNYEGRAAIELENVACEKEQGL